MDWTHLRLTSLNDVDLKIANVAPSDPFILKGVEGLGAPDRSVTIGNALNVDPVLQSINPQNRVVVARIGLAPAWDTGQTVSDLRKMFYSMLTGGFANAPVILKIMNNTTVVCRVDCHVEKLEDSMFAKDPELQLTLLCLSPYFKDEVAQSPSMSAVSKFSPVLPNIGTAPTGFDLAVTFTGSLSTWALEDSRGLVKMQVDYPFVSGDLLEFNTQGGQKGVYLTRTSEQESLLRALTADSGWLQLYEGSNVFNTTSPAFNWTTFTYTPRYQGV